MPRLNPRTEPPANRPWKLVKVAIVSGVLGACVAALLLISLTARLGPRLAGVLEALGPQPETITESPTAIMQWYHQFDEAAERQAAAAARYYNHYVEWELTIDEMKAVGQSVQIVSEDPGAPPDVPPYTVWSFFTDQADVAQLREDRQVTVRGKIVFLNAGNIFLGDCSLLGAAEG